MGQDTHTRHASYCRTFAFSMQYCTIDLFLFDETALLHSVQDCSVHVFGDLEHDGFVDVEHSYYLRPS